MDYEGGYYFLNEELIRTGIHAHTTALDRPISQETLDALNLVQATPWRINTWALDVIREAFVAGSNLGDIPYVDEIPLPPKKSDEEWGRMSAEERSAWKQHLADIHGANARMLGRRQAFVHKLDIAETMKEHDRIWFPHFLCFRGRFYPMPQDLHPQGDDISKALIHFAIGKPLTERGMFWLAVRLANTFGQDKLSLKDRVRWVHDHSELIHDSAIDPLDGQRFWTEADDPWCFLVTCHEWHEAWSQDDPYSFVSHLPIPQDGSCNGLQHLAAMGRDPVGARATNVAANEERQDIYLQVADLVKKAVTKAAVEGNELAHEWVGRIGRKTVKRAVMTTPYGVTDRGIAEQLIKDKHTAGMKHRKRSADYLRGEITEALEATVVSAKQIMTWIQTVAETLSRHGIPFRFTTPTGNVIQQSYHSVNLLRVRTLMGLLALWEEDSVGGLSDRKQRLASAPNLIHAFDASHQTKTVNAMGPDCSFSMIHDSFGVHACDTDRLAEVLRDEFAKIYEENWLQKIEDEIRAYAPGVNIPSYREFVTLGDFDVNECRRSDFFFA